MAAEKGAASGTGPGEAAGSGPNPQTPKRDAGGRSGGGPDEGRIPAPRTSPENGKLGDDSRELVGVGANPKSTPGQDNSTAPPVTNRAGNTNVSARAGDAQSKLDTTVTRTPSDLRPLGSQRDPVPIYRNVDEREFNSIAGSGRFASGPGTMEGKWFAAAGEHAEKWGSRLNNDEGLTVTTNIPRSVADSLVYRERLDGIGPAYYAYENDLNVINDMMDGIRLWTR